MGLLSKNLTLKIVEWQDTTSNTMVYKFPMDGRKLFYGSKLTVRESQVAVFVNKGKIADVFTPGMYSLHTQNLPILSSLLGLPYGFKSPFFADVYFVNTKQFTNQKWGTTNPITMRDKEFGPIRLRAYGTFSFKVTDAGTFMKEVFGTNSEFSTESIVGQLKSMVIAGISDTIAESKISALDLACNLLEFNDVVKNNLKEMFEKLGLGLTNCIIENISFPEEVEKAIDKRSSMGVLGDKMDDYVKFQSAEAIRDAAKNPGVAGIGTQIGTGMALGEMVRDAMAPKTATAKTETTQTATKECPKCKAQNKPRAKFCSECGAKFDEEKFCPECGAKVSSRAKFCPECGTKVAK